MKTALLPANDPEAIARAVAALDAGEPVGLPTETVYGLAADALNPAAAARIFEAKERPFFDPLIVHLPGLEWLAQVVSLPLPSPEANAVLWKLVKCFWPGPLTVLLPRSPGVIPDLVTAGSPLVAVRISSHPVFQAVVEAFARPVAAPSANRFGRISPTDGAHVLSELDGRIPLILDAGPTTHGLESTIVEPLADGSLRVLRPGPVTAEMLGEIAPLTRRENTPGSAAAPGQLASHYAPRTPLELLPEFLREPPAGSGRGGEWRLAPVPHPPLRIGLLAFRRDKPLEWVVAERREFLSADGNLREAAASLFAALRRLDEAGSEHLWAEPVPETGLGVAINERLRRAAAR